jgi:hypothetical protein
MKKRRNLIISVLLVAALALGIGYAALSDTLTLGGKVELSGSDMETTFDGLVYFTNGTVTNVPAAHISSNVAVTNGGDEASYTITGMKTVGDEVVMEYVIHNAYEHAVWVVIESHDEVDPEDPVQFSNTFPAQGQKIEPNADAKFTVTVTLVKLFDLAEGETVETINHNITFKAYDEDPSTMGERQ